MIRFSHFAKSGGEAFLMGQGEERVSDSDKIRIIVSTESLQRCYLFILNYANRMNLEIKNLKLYDVRS